MGIGLDTALVAIDPGTERSGVVEIGPQYHLLGWRHIENDAVVETLRQNNSSARRALQQNNGKRAKLLVVIEALQCYGKVIGHDVLATAFWSGRFAQAILEEAEVYLMPRIEVRRQFANGNSINRVNDVWIKVGLAQRFGDKILHGVNQHCIQAYALGVTLLDLADAFREQYRCQP